MAKGKNKVTKENIEEYKKLYEARNTLTDQDIKKVLIRMGINLSVGLGISFLFPPNIFIVSLIIALITTYGIAVKTVDGLVQEKEKNLSSDYPDLNISIGNDDLLKQIQVVEEEMFYGYEDQSVKAINSHPSTVTRLEKEEPKILVKRPQERKINKQGRIS